MKTYDYLIIGGGVIGTSIARALAQKKPQTRIALLEKESFLGAHASGRNSGVIHSGINQHPGTLKAKFCLEGSRLLRDYCRHRHVPMAECGTLVTARNDGEVVILEKLLEMAKVCGVPGVRLLPRKELLEREPLAKGSEALFSPTGATVDSLALLQALEAGAKKRGVSFFLSRKILGIDGNHVRTAEETFEADHIINCAGLYADRIAHMMGAGLDYRIIPFRGEYMEVKNCNVRTMIYRPPDLRFPFLSIHLTRETDGRVIAGPSATLSFGREAYEKNWIWPELLDMLAGASFWRLMTRPEFIRLCFENILVSSFRRFFFREIQSLISDIQPGQLVPYRSGIRAQMIDRQGKFVNDLLVEKGPRSTHILNAVSPGMTCSLAFADYVIDRYL